MPWTKTRNVYSRSSADPNAEQAIQDSNMVGTIWGQSLPVSSKEDGLYQRMVLDQVRTLIRSMGKSGWLQRSIFSFSGSYPAHSFRINQSKAYVDGLFVNVVGSNLNSASEGQITLSAPPGTGTRYDLVFLEVWLAEVAGSTITTPSSVNKPSTTSVYKYGNVEYGGVNPVDDINESSVEINRRVQVQYRLRSVAGVDFTTYPYGVNDPIVTARGPNPAPTATSFSIYTTVPGEVYTFAAGDGSALLQSTLGTLDGYVYALPIAKVLRTAGVNTISSGDVTDLRTIWDGSFSRPRQMYGSRGLRVSPNATTPTTKVDIAVSHVVLKAGSQELGAFYGIAVELEKSDGIYQVTNDISVVGPNGRDQSAALPNNTWAYLYLVWDQAGGLRSIASTLTPLLGPNSQHDPFTHWCYVGPMRINGSGQIDNFHIRGDRWTWKAAKVPVSNSNVTAETQVDLITVAPPDAQELMLSVYARLNHSTVTSNTFVIRAEASASDDYQAPINAVVANQWNSNYVVHHLRVPGQAIPMASIPVYYQWIQATGDGGRQATIAVLGARIPNGGN